MPEMERRSFLGLAVASLPLTLFGQSSELEAPSSGASGGGRLPAASSEIRRLNSWTQGDSTCMGIRGQYTRQTDTRVSSGRENGSVLCWT